MNLVSPNELVYNFLQNIFFVTFIAVLSVIASLNCRTSSTVVVVVVISPRHRSQESQIRRRDQSKDTLVILA